VGRRARYDVVVIGAGPAGAAAATALARTGRSILLVDETAEPPGWRVGEGAPPGLDGAVDEVFGSGTFVAADHLRSYGNRSAWGSDEAVVTDFMLNPFGAGWHLDRVAFDARLLVAAEAAGATVRRGVDGGDLAAGAEVVIDATGRRAAYARRRGARLVAHDRLTAVVAVYARRDDDDDTMTTVEAVEDGWWYTSAIPRLRRVVAFLTDGDLLLAGLRSADRFDEQVRRTRHITAVVDGHPGPPTLFAAGTAHLDRPAGDGWLAVGDAAACFDPLSSQGILTAVLMGGAVTTGIDEPEGYVGRYRAIVDRYRAEQRATYALERRWPDAAFWARRGGGSPVTIGP
jgi:flavin-dependent dehydrogenase